MSVAAMIGGAAASKAMDLANTVGTSYLNNLMGYYFGKKSEKKSLQRQLAYAEVYAKNSPSWTVEGLRRANLNPILAATDGAFSSPTVPSVSTPSFSGGGSPGDSILDGLNTLSNLRTADKQRDLMDAQTALNEADAELLSAKKDTELVQQSKLMADAEKARVEADNARHTKGINNEFNAGASILTHGIDGLNWLLKHAPSSGSSPSVDSHDVKSTSVPSGFKSNWSDSTSAGKFFNDIDRRVYQDRLERKRQKDKSYLQGQRRGRGPKRK